MTSKVNSNNRMSIREIARQLGVSHTLLVLWLQGKRTLAPELQRRYAQLVTTTGESGYNGSKQRQYLHGPLAQLAEHRTFNPGVQGSSP